MRVKCRKHHIKYNFLFSIYFQFEGSIDKSVIRFGVLNANYKNTVSREREKKGGPPFQVFFQRVLFEGETEQRGGVGVRTRPVSGSKRAAIKDEIPSLIRRTVLYGTAV